MKDASNHTQEHGGEENPGCLGIAVVLLFLLLFASSAHATTYSYTDLGSLSHLNVYTGSTMTSAESNQEISVSVDDSGGYPIVRIVSAWAELFLPIIQDFEDGANEGFDEVTGYFFNARGGEGSFTMNGETFAAHTYGDIQRVDDLALYANGAPGTIYELFLYPQLVFNGAQTPVHNPEPATLLLFGCALPFLRRRRKNDDQEEKSE